MKTLALFCCLALMALEAQPPVFHGETNLVLVDAIVTDKKGQYVPDLTAKDFRIWENNKEQSITSLSLETDSSAQEPVRLVLFFDNLGMSVADQADARQAAASFIDNTFTDTKSSSKPLVAVVNFDGGFHLAQSFTENATRLKDSLRRVSLVAPNSNDIPLAREQVAADARGLIPSVANLARNLNAAPGRKVIILLTGATALAAARPADAASLVQIANRSNVTIYPVVRDAGVQDAAGTALDLGQRPPPQFRNRSTTTRGNEDIPLGPANDNLLATIAKETGGVLFPGSDLAGQLQKIAAEQTERYVIGFTPRDAAPGLNQETCHALRVKVNRGGVSVRVRSNYCVAKPQDLLAASRVEQDLEKRAAASESGGGAFLQAPFFYVAPNLARVHVAMDIPADALKFEDEKGKPHAEMNILGIAAAEDGSVAARFSDILKRDLDGAQDLDKFKDKPLHYEKEFKIIPGQYHLTVVFSSGGASFGKVEMPLAVGAYDAGQFALSGLALSKEVRPASELGLATALIDEGTPMMAGRLQLVPTGSNVFAKTGRAYCYFEVYTSGAQNTVQLRVLDPKTGSTRWDTGSARLDVPAKGKSTIPVGLSIPVASLTAGSYQLEVTASDGTQKKIKRTIDFEIK